MSAFHSAQPRPRDQVPASAPRSARNRVAGRAGEERPRDHDVTGRVADAGASRSRGPRRAARRARGGCSTATSPWNQTGSRSHVVRIASSQTRSTRVARDLGAERGDGVVGLLGVGREWAAAVEVVLARARPVRSRPRGRARAGSRRGRSRTAAGRRSARRPRGRRRASDRPTTGTGSRRPARPRPPGSGSAAGAAGRAPAATAAPSRPAWRTTGRSGAGS